MLTGSSVKARGAEALAQLPWPTRQQAPEQGLEVVVRSDSADASHGFVNATVTPGLDVSVGFDVTEPVRDAILRPTLESWVPAITKELEDLEGAEVAETTSLFDLDK